jgi:hypothetical protein
MHFVVQPRCRAKLPVRGRERAVSVPMRSTARERTHDASFVNGWTQLSAQQYGVVKRVL